MASKVRGEHPGGSEAARWAKAHERDIESQEALLSPELSAAESAQRWMLVRKVYAILSVQLLVTAAVACAVVTSPTLRHVLTANMFASWVFLLSPLALLVPLIMYRQRHPTNLMLLFAFTIAEALGVGVICSVQPGRAIAQAFGLTACAAMSLTSYTFYAVRRGHSFSYMGPTLSTCLWVLIGWSIMQVLLPLPSAFHSIAALGGAALFGGFLVYDTGELIKRHSIDDYILAAVELYLDLLNMFIHLLRFFNDNN